MCFETNIKNYLNNFIIYFIFTYYMKIDDKGWYRFLVPIPFDKNDTEEHFLKKAKDCLDAFFEKYTEIEKKDEHNPLNKPYFGEDGLEKLKGEFSAWSFKDFKLRGMPNCNIDFYVGTPQDNYGNIGIDILTDANKIDQKIKIDFLKQLWLKFDYNF